jgi:hypothetical protein
MQYSYSQTAFQSAVYLYLCCMTSASSEFIYKNLQSASYLNSKQEDVDTISEILLRAAREPEFRNQLIKQPSNILEQYNISNEAKAIIKNSITDLTQ